jgi:hypothetical protein
LILHFIDFFWRRFYQKNAFALFTLATGLTKRYSWPQIEKWNLLDLHISVCCLFCIYGLDIYHSEVREKVLEPRNIIVSCSFMQPWFSIWGSFPLINQLSKWS